MTTTPLFWRNKVVLAALEATYGTDAAPTALANAIRMVNVSFEPMAGNTATRDLDLPYMGAQAEIQTDLHAVLTGEFEISGSGSAGTAPKWGPLARMCGFAETVTAGTKVDYTLVSSGFEAGTVYLQIDRNLHKLTGSRGLLGLRIQPGQVPRFLVRIMGLWNQPGDAAIPTPDLTGWVDPIVVSDDNTDFEIDGLAAALEQLEVPVPGQGLEGRFLVNSESVQITDHPYRGTLMIQAPRLTEKNFFALAQAGSQVPMLVTHGTAAGNTVEISAPNVQIGRPPYGQTQGITNHALPITLIPQPGVSELRITAR